MMLGQIRIMRLQLARFDCKYMQVLRRSLRGFIFKATEARSLPKNTV